MKRVATLGSWWALAVFTVGSGIAQVGQIVGALVFPWDEVAISIVAIYVFPSLLLVGLLWLVAAPGSMLLLAMCFRRVRA